MSTFHDHILISFCNAAVIISLISLVLCWVGCCPVLGFAVLDGWVAISDGDGGLCGMVARLVWGCPHVLVHGLHSVMKCKSVYF